MAVIQENEQRTLCYQTGSPIAMATLASIVLQFVPVIFIRARTVDAGTWRSHMRIAGTHHP